MYEHQLIPCNVSRLPLELWSLVLECLSRMDQRSCLSVSSSFRDLARPLLFSRITLHYGLWKAQSRNLVFSRDVDERGGGFSLPDLRLMDRLCVTNTELLQHVARDAQFARLVRTISVRAHDEMKWCDADDIQHLIRALESIPHLQSFQWYGSHPPLPSSVLDVITRTCGSTLTELSICGILDSDEDASWYLGQLRNLQTLSLAGDRRHLPIYTRSRYQLMIKTCVLHAPHSLLRLSILGDSIWDTPLRVLSGLQELSMHNPCSLERLDDIFVHCPRLRSLNIINSSSTCMLQVLAALDAAPSSALPHLTSFKFFCAGDSRVVHLGPFLAFLRNKRGLRRLDLRFWGVVGHMHLLDIFLDIFASLPQLEVVGLTLTDIYFSQEHLRLLDARLPLGLSALLLSLACTPPAVMGGWITMLERRPSLRYFHLVDYAYSLDLRDALLRARLPTLELVGYGAHMASITRDRATGESAYGPRWKEETIGFGTAEDFGCGDWPWLLQYHNWDELP